MSENFPLPAGYVNKKLRKDNPYSLPSKPSAPKSLVSHGRFLNNSETRSDGSLKISNGKNIMRPKPLIPKNALAKRKRTDAGALPLDAIRELSSIPDLKEHFKNSTQYERERVITFLRTFNSEAVVGAMFGICRRQVERAVNHNRGIMDNAKVARSMAISGLAEDKAIETLRSLDISKVPDERKGRLVRDLVDSSAVASESVKLPEKKAEESTMELIFRIRNRGQQPLPKPSESEDAIDADFEEQKTLPEKTT